MLADKLAKEQVDALDKTLGKISSLHTLQVRDLRQGQAEVHGDALFCMLNIFGETLSKVEIDTLANTVVEKQARMQVGSLKNKLAKTKRSALLDKLVARLLGV